MVDPALGVLPGGDHPVRRGGGADEEHRFAQDVGVDRGVEIRRELTRQLEQLPHQAGAHEAGPVHPGLVETIEQPAEVPARLLLGHELQAVGGAVPLPGQQGEVVAEHVEGDALDRPRRALGR